MSEPVDEKELDDKLRISRKLVEYWKQELEIVKTKLILAEERKKLEAAEKAK
jgi:hypothetical protein